ncbi:hypothetical protein BaRGS_00010343 [Batillaria attramentaria]|uniref:Phosphatidic acid phosphatase type 2/haloperoxidase domain-containing protein n=1 Tax=Batillaria attramentaria TaxID=370345 RepID=A0ABD0LFM2_9CAEN
MRNRNIISEVTLRLVLFIVFTITDNADPFQRSIQPEEMWMYRYPHGPSYYPAYLMWITVLSVPTIVFFAFYILRRDTEDLLQACLGVLLSIYVTGCITNFVKLAIGRPRPDFLYRCYPEGPPRHIIELQCTGNEAVIIEGRKSFPSGHSSLSFASLGFVSLYIAGKLQVFNRGRGQGLRFICFLFPLVWALMIAVSRTSDYHHHWQDVTIGSIMGLVGAYTCYRQVYPSLTKVNSHLCYSQIPPVIDSRDNFDPEPITPVSPHPKSHATEFQFVSKIV